MKNSKNRMLKLAGDAAFVAAITLINRFLEKRETSLLKRSDDEKALNRKLNLVNILYHMIGVFYNE